MKIRMYGTSDDLVEIDYERADVADDEYSEGIFKILRANYEKCEACGHEHESAPYAYIRAQYSPSDVRTGTWEFTMIMVDENKPWPANWDIIVECDRSTNGYTTILLIDTKADDVCIAPVKDDDDDD